jgi:DNA-binding PadR family transcriptional regulator
MKFYKLVPRGMLKFTILKLLKKGPKHGYEIKKLIEKQTGWEPSPGALYPMLHQMKKQGFISKAKSSSKKRIPYKLTKKGKNLISKIEKNKKSMKKTVGNFLTTMGQAMGIKQDEMRNLIETNRIHRRHRFFTLPPETRKYFVKTRKLSLEIAKDKSKHKKMEKLIKEYYKKLLKLKGG